MNSNHSGKALEALKKSCGFSFFKICSNARGKAGFFAKKAIESFLLSKTPKWKLI